MSDLHRIDDGPVATVCSGHRDGVAVALKIFPRKFDKRTRSAFGKEQARLARVRRIPSVLMVDGVDELPTGEPALRMELCAGSLTGMVERVGPLPVADVMTLGRAMATALAAAHGAGVIHGGVSPNNVLFRRDGGPALADFGVTLRRAFTRDPLHAIEYLPPETLRDATLDEATDLYGMGAVLHFAMTGRSPHPGRLGEQPGERVLRILGEPIPAVNRPDIPVGLSTVVARLLAVAPEHRTRDAATVADQFTAMVPGHPPPTDPWDDFDTGGSGPSPWAPPPAPPRHGPPAVPRAPADGWLPANRPVSPPGSSSPPANGPVAQPSPRTTPAPGTKPASQPATAPHPEPAPPPEPAHHPEPAAHPAAARHTEPARPPTTAPNLAPAQHPKPTPNPEPAHHPATAHRPEPPFQSEPAHGSEPARTPKPAPSPQPAAHPAAAPSLAPSRHSEPAPPESAPSPEPAPHSNPAPRSEPAAGSEPAACSVVSEEPSQDSAMTARSEAGERPSQNPAMTTRDEAGEEPWQDPAVAARGAVDPGSEVAGGVGSAVGRVAGPVTGVPPEGRVVGSVPRRPRAGEAIVLAGPLERPDRPRRFVRYDLLAGAALVLALLALVPLLLLRGDPEPIGTAPRIAPAEGAGGGAVTVELAEPTDLRDTVRLSWQASHDLDFAVVVAGEGQRTEVLLAERERSMVVDVEPERKYCFLVQASDGDRVYESEPRSVRGAVCRK